MSEDSPKLALSVRQPWAWLIVNGLKDVENRTWPTCFRGRVLIHAGKTMTKAEYEACVLFIAGVPRLTNWRLPAYDVLKGQCGGIVGLAKITGCVKASSSPWFCGPYGFTLAEPLPFEFEPCPGALGFFKPNPCGRPGYRRSFIGEPKA